MYNLGDRRIVQIGCGAVGHCMLPLYLRHFSFMPKHVVILDMRESALADAAQYPTIQFVHAKITPSNYVQVLDRFVRRGDIVVDLAWYINTVQLLTWCRHRGAHYVNTAVERWRPDDCDIMDKPCQPLYTEHHKVRNLARKWGRRGPTAVISHGANPGWVSHACKQGIRDWVMSLSARDPIKTACIAHLARGDLARVAQLLEIQAIHIAERDTQVSRIPRQVGEFVNTWSPTGFVEEGMLPAEMGWGTHETLKQGVHHFKRGPKNEVYMDSMGMNTLVKTHVPSGDIVGMIIPHEEANSISYYLTVTDGGKPVYRPTVHYAYYPPNDSIASMYEFQSNGYSLDGMRERVMKDDITSGKDELGVFMMSKRHGCWWIGSLLDIDTARKLIPHESATTVQVGASVMGAIVYMMSHPDEGPVFPEDMHSDEVMAIVKPYLGEFVSFPLKWEPKHVPAEFAKNPNWIIQKLLVR